MQRHRGYHGSSRCAGLDRPERLAETSRPRRGGATGGLYATIELLLIIANLGTAVLPFSLFKRDDERLALGFITARLVECGFIVGVGNGLILSCLMYRSSLVPRRMASSPTQAATPGRPARPADALAAMSA
jgi:hypothetical protein